MIKVLTIPEFDKSLKKLSRKFHSLKEEFHEFIEKTEITLIAIYDKNETSSIDRKYLEALIKKYK